LIDTIAIHFVRNSHPPIELEKNCRLLYVHKYIITVWLIWLKSSHISYKDTIEYTCIKYNVWKWNTKANNDINVLIKKYWTCKCQKCTNIIYSTKKVQQNWTVIKTSGSINLNGIDINQHEQMTNTFKYLHGNQYLSYNHHTTMINEYNNLNLISCSFPPYFLSKFESLKWITNPSNYHYKLM